MPKSHVFGDLVLVLCILYLNKSANITSFNENMLDVQRLASDNSSEATKTCPTFSLVFCAYFLHDMEVPQSCQLLTYMLTLDLFHLPSFFFFAQIKLESFLETIQIDTNTLFLNPILTYDPKMRLLYC